MHNVCLMQVNLEVLVFLLLLGSKDTFAYINTRAWDRQN